MKLLRKKQNIVMTGERWGTTCKDANAQGNKTNDINLNQNVLETGKETL